MHAAKIILDKNCAASRLPLMGGKAANLHRMSTQGIPVPDWVCLSSHACSALYAQHESAIEDCLSAIDYQDQASIHQASDSIRGLIESWPMPELIRRNVGRVLNKMDASHYAVRSSGLAEDSAAGSYAGLFDTFLYVARADVIDRIKSCWASAYSARNLVYIQRNGATRKPRPVAVVIQVMIDSEAAGVMFMANPAGSLDEIVVVSGYGLGEGVVSDRVETDTCIYDRTRSAWRCDIGDKRKSVRFDAAVRCGTFLADVPKTKRHEPVLTEKQRETLRVQGERISRLYDQFQDIEWAFDAAGELFITQSRPITTIPRGQQFVFDNSNIVESYPGVTSPLTVSHIRQCYEVIFRNSLLRLGVSKKLVRQHNHIFKNMLGYIGGRVYYNLSNWYRMFRLVPAVEPYLPVWEEMLGISRRIEPARKSWLQRVKQVPRFLWVAAHVLWYFLFLRFYMNSCAQSFRHSERKFRVRDIADLDNHELADLHDRLNADELEGWDITLLNDLYAFVFTAAARRQLRKVGLDENAFGGLMAADDELESAAPVRSIIVMADAVRRDLRLSQQLEVALALSAEDQRFEQIETLFDDDGFVSGLRHHLEHFGDRCPEELKLESTCFRDDPQSLLRLVSTYAASNLDLNKLNKSRLEAREEASASLRSALHGKPLRRLLMRCTLSLARRSIRYRESSRLDRARAFGLIRSIFRTMGRNLASEGVLSEPRDVFYLTSDELLGFVTGTTVNDRLQTLVAERRADRDRYLAITPAERVRTQGTVRANTVPPKLRPTAGQSSGTLQGTGCSVGLVSAEAVLVNKPADAGDVTGKVLVAEMTDPGWVFLMASAAALVVEKGSLLSHTAIIGRELGVPTVVGVEGATELIRSGQRVQVNGQTGEVCLQGECSK